METLRPELVHCVVQMATDTTQTVSFIWIAHLLEQNGGVLQRSRKSHGLLEMHIIISISMDKQEVMISHFLDASGHISVVISRQVIFISWQSHVPFCVNGIVVNPRCHWRHRQTALEYFSSVLGNGHGSCISTITPAPNGSVSRVNKLVVVLQVPKKKIGPIIFFEIFLDVKTYLATAVWS